MKKTLLTIAAALMLVNQGMAAGITETEEKELITPINNVLMSSTVKAGDEVKPVISGLFPNGCYRYSKVEIEHDNANKVHEERTYETVSQGMCLMVLVPFSREISLGAFSVGEHRVRFLNGDGTYMEKKVVAE